MATMNRARDQGLGDAASIRQAVAKELRETRQGLGLSQEAVGRAAGLSRSQVSRIERSDIDAPDIVQICRCARALGLQASLKLYPGGTPVRDAAHLSLLGRLEALLAQPLRMRREVPLPLQGDERGWDAVVDGVGKAGVEAETRLGDIQAGARRVGLKSRDDPRIDVVILVVSRTRHNLAVLREHRAALRAQFPLDSGDIRRALSAGVIPSASGILVL